MTKGARFFGDNACFTSEGRSFDGDELVFDKGVAVILFAPGTSSKDGPVIHEIIASPNTFRRQLPGALMDLS